MPTLPYIDRSRVIWLALLTLFGFGGIGLLVIHFFVDRSFMEMVMGGYAILEQLIIGILFGTISAFTGWGIIRMPFMQRIRAFYTNMIGGIGLRLGDILLISICAGVGEEILFRGAVQPFLGLWPTSILFVFLHGYLDPFNYRMSIYGVFMTLVIAGIGTLYDHVGAISAMSAHTMIDLILLILLTRTYPQQEEEEEMNEAP